MLEAFTIGAVLVPTRPVAVLLCVVLAVWAVGRLAARADLDARRTRGVAEGAAWLGLAGARLGYVLVNWSAFRPQPWTALYLWQPGYLPYAGVVLGAAYAAWRVGRRPGPERGRALRVLGAGYAIGAVALGAVFLALHWLAPSGVLRPGDRVPDFALVDLAGDTVRLSDLAGRGVVLNFWATWCPPCRREMPLLDAVQDEYGPRGLTVVGIDLDEPADVVAAFVTATGVGYPIWVDPPTGRPGHDRTRAVYERFGGVGLPTTVFIGRDRLIRDQHVGELNLAFLRERVEEILAR